MTGTLTDPGLGQWLDHILVFTTGENETFEGELLGIELRNLRASGNSQLNVDHVSLDAITRTRDRGP
jgi:hypothetical protein